MARVAELGQEAYYLDLDAASAPDRASRTLAAAAWLRERLPGADVIVGGGVVVVANVQRSPEIESVLVMAAGAPTGSAPPGRRHVIRVVYAGPDLEASANALRMSVGELIDRHVSHEVMVELVGFLPGFGYLGPIDPRLVMPRRPSPRPSVPAGSVGIAGSFTGIYPFASPGGWNLLGRATGIRLFDPARESPMLFAPGDHVRFERVEATDAQNEAPPPALTEESKDRGLVVLSAQAGVTVQDGGRPSQLAAGIPPSGPLDPDAHAAANEAVGNPRSAAAIEVPLGSLAVRARGSLLVSVDGEAPVQLADGEELRVAPVTRAVRYLAVRGGINVPTVLGARATLLVAKMGGFYGRILRARDVLPVGPEPDNASPRPGQYDTREEMIVADPGPHVDRFPDEALDTFFGTTFQVSRLWDRVGMRLDGGKIPRDRPDLAMPVPMVRGAVQVSTDGTPIVLGPDHPTTGGYPVIAVVRRSSWGALSRKRAGETVRFLRPLTPAA